MNCLPTDNSHDISSLICSENEKKESINLSSAAIMVSTFRVREILYSVLLVLTQY